MLAMCRRHLFTLFKQVVSWWTSIPRNIVTGNFAEVCLPLSASRWIVSILRTQQAGHEVMRLHELQHGKALTTCILARAVPSEVAIDA